MTNTGPSSRVKYLSLDDYIRKEDVLRAVDSGSIISIVPAKGRFRYVSLTPNRIITKVSIEFYSFCMTRLIVLRHQFIGLQPPKEDSWGGCLRTR